MTEHLPLNTRPLPLKLRIEDYLLLDEAGAFSEYAKTELIDGEIFYMNAQHRPHALLKMDLYDRLRDALRALRSTLRPIVEVSLEIPPRSVPEPDIVLTNEPGGKGLVPLGSVALVIEVADSTIRSDLEAKAGLYARNGIPEYWVAEVDGRLIHQMWNPQGDSFSERREVLFGEALTAETVPGLGIDTTGL